MTSEAQGNLIVPVWINDGIVTPIADDEGLIPVSIGALDCQFNVVLQSSDITLDINIKSQDIVPDVNLKTSSITLPVSEQSPLSSIQAQGYGYDNVAWRKQGLVWAYYDRYIEGVNDTTMPAGNSNLVGSTVPAGEVWRVLGYSAQVTSGSSTGWRIIVQAGVGDAIIDEVVNPSSTTLYPKQIDIVLKEGDYIYIRFYGMTLNDDAYFYLWGYKMKVAM